MANRNSTLFDVLKPIRYKGPGPNFRKLIKPGDEAAKGLSFSHLIPAEIELLSLKGYIRPTVVKAAEAVKEAGGEAAKK